MTSAEPAVSVQRASLVQRADEPETTVIVLKGGAAYLAREYWAEGGALHCVSPGGDQKLFALEALDLDQTVRVNGEPHVEFVLRSKQPVEQ